MKNKNKILVYDDACPLCAWYTGAFVKAGILPEEGRQAFSSSSPELLSCFNRQQGNNEIPLIDQNTHQVWYGIDAMLEMLGERFPLVKTIGYWQPVNWLLKKIYRFISYNRKVIVAKKPVPGAVDCTPDFSIRYRMLFMAIFLLFNTLMLFPIHNYLLTKVPLYTASTAGLQTLHTILVCINCLLALVLPVKVGVEYLGQVNMLALVTILLLVPLLLLNAWFGLAAWLNIGYLLLLSVFIVKEYFRRMAYAGITRQHQWIVFVNLAGFAALITGLFIL